MLVDIYKGFRDSIYVNDNEDREKESTWQILSDKYCSICIERYSCQKRCDHYKREYRKERYKKKKHTVWSIYQSNQSSKRTTHCRNKNLDPDSSHGRGYITEVLVSKFLGISTCFEITDNFNYPRYDLLEHEDWGKVDAKGSILHSRNDKYHFHHFNTRKNDIPDFFFCIGYDEYIGHVDRVYIVPNEEYINKLGSINIPRDGYSIYHMFREDEKPWDDLFRTLKLDDCPVLRKR